MTVDRPDPEALLARVKEEAARRTRGRLTIFFGAAAGVGKTHAMLEAARIQRAAGVDEVAGGDQTHTRAGTEAVLAGGGALTARIGDTRGGPLRDIELVALL